MNKSTFPLDTLTQYEVAKGQHCGKTSLLLKKLCYKKIYKNFFIINLFASLVKN
jgi:hypothetical protein